MKQAIIYTLKIWLSTILLAPALRILMVKVFDLPLVEVSFTNVEYAELAIFYGSIFSVPAAVMMWIFIVIINRKKISLREKKTYISALVFIEMTLTFYYIFWLPGSLRINTIMTIPYVIIAAIAIWYYKLKSPIVTKQ